MAKKKAATKDKENDIYIVEYKGKGGHIHIVDKVFNNKDEIEQHTKHYNILDYEIKVKK